MDWIKLNHDSIGYYIVNYTEDAWNVFGNLLFYSPSVRATQMLCIVFYVFWLIIDFHVVSLIIFTLKLSQALSAMNRADLLHDAFLLAGAGLNYSTAMNLTFYLMNEHDYQPWAVAMEWFGQMNRLLHKTHVLRCFRVL